MYRPIIKLVVVIWAIGTPMAVAGAPGDDQTRIQDPGRAFMMPGSPASGGSYSLMIPYVTHENNRRTNVGFNNYSSRSMMKGDNPDANVSMVLYDRDGNVAGNGTAVVHSNEMLQMKDVI